MDLKICAKKTCNRSHQKFHQNRVISQKYTVLQKVLIFHFNSRYTIAKGIDMFPKRSTPVDQTLEFETIHSQLSMAIFRASRTYVVAQKS